MKEEGKMKHNFVFATLVLQRLCLIGKNKFLGLNFEFFFLHNFVVQTNVCMH